MKRNLKWLAVFCLAACILPIYAGTPSARPSGQNGSDEFEMMMEKIRQDFRKNPDISKILSLYDAAKGCFTDIDYDDMRMTKWPPLTHLERLQDMACAYTHPSNPHYESKELFDKIEKGLAFWQEKNPECKNWWYNQIAEPQRLGTVLILLRAGKEQIPSELESQMLARMKQDGGDPAKWTGANRTDIALHWIYRSCLSRNDADLRFALDNVYSPLVYTTGEGFQPDNSNFQHGTQLYIGGYGDDVLKGITQVAMYTHGTAYAIPADKLALMSKFMRETYYATIRGQYMVYDVLGRSVSRPGLTNKSRTALYAQRMITLDPAHADEFKDIVSRLKGVRPAHYKITPKHTHYFRGDYTLHVRPGYTFDVRMASTRTSRCEYGNEENLKTYFLSDGCNNIVRTGNEYADIFPVWNWTRIPGTTAPQLQDIPLPAQDWSCPGISTFAGGVSDSIYGATTYAYMDTYAGINTGAHKSWFFFDDEVVCLGSGITSTSPAAICTTVNQCLLRGKPVTVCKDGKAERLTANTENSIQSPTWILHNSVGYVFPQGGNLFVNTLTQAGIWYEINHSMSKDPQRKGVFSLGFEHGKQPSNATYAYIVVPGKQNADEMNAYCDAKAITIAANTPNLQAVAHQKLNIRQMIFHTAGEFSDSEVKVTTDKPCALMLRRTGERTFRLHLADPAQAQGIITVQIALPKLSGKEQTVKCDFSGDPIYAGATRAYTLTF